MKQIIDYLWNASPEDALFAIALAVLFLVWIVSIFFGSDLDEPPL